MVYRITKSNGPDLLNLDDFPYEFENPLVASRAFAELRKRFPVHTFLLFRGEEEVGPDLLIADIESFEIGSVREAENMLPGGFRYSSFGNADLAVDLTGQIRGVWRPPNPDDRFE
jgi:hypothetical protein